MQKADWGRREVLAGLSAVISTSALGVEAAKAQDVQVKWSSGTELPKLKPPANACDCHHHIYESKYPVDP
jgi:D-galactarolactone isomerase